ncbi:hypothetical protein UJ101_01281 [Flavobacteriaceae bacterium UJ101]|nr:hypothetical protein UJ101_01281 [Flavobacteriaceae bacterium UJ101]
MRYLIIILSFILVSCNSTKSVKNEPLLYLQKTACFGACPIYKATIYSDGKIMYNGEKFTPYIGETETQLSKKELNDLIQDFEDIQFEQYSSHYVNNKISDIPSTIIQYRGKQVTIRGFKVPPKLTALINKTQKTIEQTLP